jgi:hypothetical protein
MTMIGKVSSKPPPQPRVCGPDCSRTFTKPRSQKAIKPTMARLTLARKIAAVEGEIFLLTFPSLEQATA